MAAERKDTASSSNTLVDRMSDRVTQDLRRMIVTMEFQEGQIVSQSFLTEQLKCGRTPLREALQRLEQEGLVEAVPGGGVAIAGLSLTSFVDLIEAQAMMESFASRLAARRVTNEALCRLDEVLAAAERAARELDFTKIAECDLDFHLTIGQATGNRYVSETITYLHHKATRFGYIGWKRAGTVAPSLQEHRGILAALRNRDPEVAERLTREHTLNSRDRIVAVLCD